MSNIERTSITFDWFWCRLYLNTIYRYAWGGFKLANQSLPDCDTVLWLIIELETEARCSYGRVRTLWRPPPLATPLYANLAFLSISLIGIGASTNNSGDSASPWHIAVLSPTSPKFLHKLLTLSFMSSNTLYPQIVSIISNSKIIETLFYPWVWNHIVCFRIIDWRHGHIFLTLLYFFYQNLINKELVICSSWLFTTSFLFFWHQFLPIQKTIQLSIHTAGPLRGPRVKGL